MDETGSRQHHTLPTLIFKARLIFTQDESKRIMTTVKDCDDTGLNLNLPCISMAMH